MKEYLYPEAEQKRIQFKGYTIILIRDIKTGEVFVSIINVYHALGLKNEQVNKCLRDISINPIFDEYLRKAITKYKGKTNLMIFISINAFDKWIEYMENYSDIDIIYFKEYLNELEKYINIADIFDNIDYSIDYKTEIPIETIKLWIKERDELKNKIIDLQNQLKYLIPDYKLLRDNIIKKIHDIDYLYYEKIDENDSIWNEFINEFNSKLNVNMFNRLCDKYFSEIKDKHMNKDTILCSLIKNEELTKAIEILNDLEAKYID